MFTKTVRMALSVGLLILGTSVLVTRTEVVAQEKQEKSDRKVLKKVEPAYPPLANQLHLTGAVKMALQVAPGGKVTNVHFTGGNPILQGAAEVAVRQWKYEAAPKETTEVVTIAFDIPK